MPNTDDLKGRAKEAFGDMTDNDEMKREGKTDRASGNVKDKIESVEESAKDAVDDVKDRFNN